jgi:hypothetical protein
MKLLYKIFYCNYTSTNIKVYMMGSVLNGDRQDGVDFLGSDTMAKELQYQSVIALKYAL